MKHRVSLSGRDMFLVRAKHPDFPHISEYALWRAVINRMANDVTAYIKWRKSHTVPSQENLHAYRDAWGWFESTGAMETRSLIPICELADIDHQYLRKLFRRMVTNNNLPHPKDALRELQENRERWRIGRRKSLEIAVA